MNDEMDLSNGIRNGENRERDSMERGVSEYGVVRMSYSVLRMA